MKGSGPQCSSSAATACNRKDAFRVSCPGFRGMEFRDMGFRDMGLRDTGFGAGVLGMEVLGFRGSVYGYKALGSHFRIYRV